VPGWVRCLPGRVGHSPGWVVSKIKKCFGIASDRTTAPENAVPSLPGKSPRGVSHFPRVGAPACPGCLEVAPGQFFTNMATVLSGPRESRMAPGWSPRAPCRHGQPVRWPRRP